MSQHDVIDLLVTYAKAGANGSGYLSRFMPFPSLADPDPAVRPSSNDTPRTFWEARACVCILTGGRETLLYIVYLSYIYQYIYYIDSLVRRQYCALALL